MADSNDEHKHVLDMLIAFVKELLEVLGARRK